MRASTDFLTVATVKYVPQAVVALRSARRHCPDAVYHLFVVDAPGETMVALRCILRMDGDWIRLFGPYDLGPGREEFLRTFKYYDQIEISCLAKYVGVSHVLRNAQPGSLCVYSDADNYYLSDFSVVHNEIGGSAVLLTPHQFGTSRDDQEHDHLLHGWINAGFLALRRDHDGSRAAVDWLVKRVSIRGYLATQYGLSCDQTWLSAVPFVFGDVTTISSHPGLNVAYWNLFERKLTENDMKINVNGCPLVFFHFSGFDPARKRYLSKHSMAEIPAGSELGKICRQYSGELSESVKVLSAIAQLKTIQCSEDSLQERIHIGTQLNGINIFTPTFKRGLFAMFGGKIDSACRKIWKLIGR